MTESSTSQENRDSSSGSLFHPQWNESELEPITSYRSVSISAIFALALGLLSFTFMVHWGYFFIPLLALFFAVLSLIRIKRSEGMIFGKPLALCGLFFCIISVFAYCAMWWTFNTILVKQARQFAPMVFETLRNDDIPGYLKLKRPRWERGETLSHDEEWAALGKNEHQVETMDVLVKNPLIRTLIALGDQAKITYFKTGTTGRLRNDDFVSLVYAVTYPASNGQETFFVSVILTREKMEEIEEGRSFEKAGWKLFEVKGPFLPEEFGGKPENSEKKN